MAALILATALAVVGGQSDSDRERAYRANNIGVAQLEQFDYEAAAASFREALKVHPALDVARLNLAIALFYGGHTADAATEARSAAERLPDVAQAHYIAGLIARAEDNLDAAAAAFQRVLKIDPSDPGAKVNLGQIALQQREFDRALSLFREAVAAEPYNVTATYSIALGLMRSGKPEEGRKAMQQFEQLRDSAYGVTYSQNYLSQGKYAEAVASTGAEPELVNPATPAVKFSDATTTMMSAPQPREGARGGVTLFDADGDGDLDLFEVNGTSQRFLRNQRGAFSDETTRAGLTAGGGAESIGAIAGDYDNDGRPDLFVLRSGGHGLLHQNAEGVFEDVTQKAMPGSLANKGSSAAFADVDHDGDLDIFVAGSPTYLLRNNGNGTFGDIAVQAGVSGPLRAVGVAATDYDNRRDIDLVVLVADAAPRLYRNLRDGSFRDTAAAAALPSAGSYSTLAVGDVNKDGFPDFFFGRPDQPGLLALSDGQTRFRTAPAPDETRASLGAQFLDYDNDGLLDLLSISDKRARLFRNLGAGKWNDVSDAAGLSALAVEGFAAVALGDVDGDGDVDAVLRTTAGLRFWKNDGGSRNASVRVRLVSRVSNRSAIGARAEMRAGSLRQQFETSSSTPSVAPSDITLGLGSRAAADVVRILWPSGILQAETGQGGSPLNPGLLTISELDRKPSSCPYLFTWNGSRFEFVTDFMGGGEMGAWLAPGTWNQPDGDEYVRITSSQLQPRDGRYELRVTNELEEALFVDRLQLVAVDHPEAVDVFPNEGLRSPPRPPLKLTTASGARLPVRAVDEHGHDVLPQIHALDRRYPDDFRQLALRGYAERHELTMDLGDRRSAIGTRGSGLGTRGSRADNIVLLMTGWTDYAFSNDNVAASHAGIQMSPPSLQVKDASGAWQTVISEIGFPVGRPQTVVVDLTGKWLSSSREVRIVTNMRIYWDRILVARSADVPTRMTRVDATAATLRWRGFSAELRDDGRQPFGYDYARVSAASPWKTMIGRYTREGDVRPLLQAVDDMYVISQPGDEISVAFDARSLPPLPSGWSRTFLLYAHGWSKEMNPRSASPDQVGPLPFFRMSGYPYRTDEHYPRTEAHREYQDRYNTRVVNRPIASIDSLLLGK